MLQVLGRSREGDDFNGIRQFDDCPGICRLAAPNPRLLVKAFNAVTGWDWTLGRLGLGQPAAEV